ncbi:uncharacterized protein A1O9_10580 [Exophiala aquamarina CBS 119918]|uniref:beta-glucosidase n=1 Tax=Exophiala aquamarina CBS 119918 TaxID=1182545 RepID=A0A072PDE8_9EURO|nr:uncharacterized protein A1O9_10580 [Exophiala aquamarina CBS 119918]KEF53605.1 hypothetical protein A1O9_10580 [Exophiala aquamarina CBS 119918]
MEKKKPVLPYQDDTRSIDDRVADLISRMKLDEKAGQLFHNVIVLLEGKLFSHFNLIGSIHDPKLAARIEQHSIRRPNLTFHKAPNQFVENVGTVFNPRCLSQWPEPLELVALRDPALVQRFADCARQEYLALGIRVTLYPRVDLATEYRWARVNATFGEDADLAGDYVEAYTRGFQGPSANIIDHTSVSTMTIQAL